MPRLGGWAVTGPRAEAETILITEDEDDPDPLLATWQVGLGRCTAFTSDASPRWAASWLPWAGFEPFWRQVARNTMAGIESGAIALATEVRGSRLRAVADARDDASRPRTDLNLRGTVLGEGVPPRDIELKQAAPGRYEGEVEGLEQGHYLVRLGWEEEGKQRMALAVNAVDFSEEHRALRSNDELLREAAALTGGRVMEPPDDPFTRDFSAVLDSVELWHWLLLATCGLLLVDASARRLDVRLRLPRREKKKRAPQVVEPKRTPVPEYEPPQPEPEKKQVAAAPKAQEKKPDKDSLGQLLKAKRKAEDRRKWK